MTTFILNSQDKGSKETAALRVACLNNPTLYNIKYCKKPSDIKLLPSEVPSGNIDWVESFLGRIITPDYYPGWAAPFFHRKLFMTDKWPLEKDIFIKPADKHKRFSGRLATGTYKGKKKGPYICSEKVQFIDEWRLYIQNNEIKYIGWYDGVSQEEISIYDMPNTIAFLKELTYSMPSTYCGAVDVGIIKDVGFALVECNSPYACGWYGHLNEGHIYAQWLIEGWKYLNNH